MPGLVPGIHGLQHGDMRKGGGWVYIMTNRPNGTLYLGVTSDIGAEGLGTPRRLD